MNREGQLGQTSRRRRSDIWVEFQRMIKERERWKGGGWWKNRMSAEFQAK